MDPEQGMGIEFSNRTLQHRRRLEQLIQQMTASPDAIADVLVEPEGLDWEDGAADSPEASANSAEGATTSPEEEVEHDPLLELFRTWPSLTKEQFLVELEKHQLAGGPGSASELRLPEPTVHQRREPRITVARPVEVRSQDDQTSFPQNTSLIDVSHHGARLGGVGLRLKVGEVVQLLSDGVEARFQVIWVGEPGTPQDGQIGLQRMTVDDVVSEG